jgi:hypothetical protein
MLGALAERHSVDQDGAVWSALAIGASGWPGWSGAHLAARRA